MYEEHIGARAVPVERPVEGGTHGKSRLWRALPYEVRAVATGVIIFVVISFVLMLNLGYTRLNSTLSGFRDRVDAHEYYRPPTDDEDAGADPLHSRQSHRTGIFCSLFGALLPRGSRCD